LQTASRSAPPALKCLRQPHRNRIQRKVRRAKWRSRIATRSRWRVITMLGRNWRRWAKRAWTWQFYFGPFRFIAMIGWKRNTPMIFAGRGTIGWRIFAKPILRGCALRRSSRCKISISRVTNRGALGLYLLRDPSNGRHIHDRYYDPLWREAEKLAAPICFHPAASPNQD